MSKNEINNPNIDMTASVPPSYSRHQYACLTLHSSDRLRLIQFPARIIDIVRHTIQTSWRRGLQNEKPYAGAYEFKLHGFPWDGQGADSVEARFFMMSILSALHHQGWYLLTSTDVSKKENSKDTLIFQLGTPPPPTSFFVVSFNESDKLRLIGASSELISAARQSIGIGNLQREEWIYSSTAYEFKLCGYPWTSDGQQTVTSRIKLLALLECFTSLGWKFHASVDMSVGDKGCGTDTWFFRRNNE